MIASLQPKLACHAVFRCAMTACGALHCAWQKSSKGLGSDSIEASNPTEGGGRAMKGYCAVASAQRLPMQSTARQKADGNSRGLCTQSTQQCVAAHLYAAT